MRVHIDRTIVFGETFVIADATERTAAQQAALVELKANITDWSLHMSPDANKQSRWIVIHTQHTLAVGKFATGVFACICKARYIRACGNSKTESDAGAELLANKALIVRFIADLFGLDADQTVVADDWWEKHIDCTAHYLKMLRQFGKDSNQYKAALKKCRRLGADFGAAMDAWAGVKTTADVSDSDEESSGSDE